MIVRRAAVVLGLLAAAGLPARAQELAPAASAVAAAQGVARGAAEGNVVPSPFRAQLVVDNRFPPKVNPPKDDEDRDPRDRTGKMHCLVCEHGLSPVVAIFVRDTPKAGDGLSNLLAKLDAKNPKPEEAAIRPRVGLIPEHRADKLAAFVMFLKLDGGTKAVTVKTESGDEMVAVDLEYPHDEKRAEKAAEVKDYFDTVKADNVPFGLAPEKSAALDAFGIGKTTPITVIIYNRLRMVKRWELTPDELTDEKAAEIVAATEAMIRGR